MSNPTIETLQTLYNQKCVEDIYEWYQIYTFINIIKFIIALQQWCHYKQQSYSSLTQVKRAHRDHERVQNFISLYINFAHVINLIIGNVIYFSLEQKKVMDCQQKSGWFNQLYSLIFVLICFGYAQGTYYIIVWCTIVYMKCNGVDPANQEDSEFEAEERREGLRVLGLRDTQIR